MCNNDTIGNRQQWRRHYLPIKILILCLFLSSSHLTNAKVKTPSRSQFTNPPSLANDDPRKNCHVSSSTIKEAINCFNNKQFNPAKTIFLGVKNIAKTNSSLFFTSQMYLAFIAIEQNKFDSAIKKINLLYSLRPNFSLQNVGIHNKKYARLFKQVKQQKLIMIEKRTNTTGKNINTEIECSLKGNCDHEITCIIEGSCNNDIECSLAGTCDK